MTRILLQFLSRLSTYLWDIHSLKSNSAVSRPGYFCLIGVNQKLSLANAFIFFLNWRYFSEMHKKRNSNLLLSKSTLKYLVYCQVFLVEMRPLQDQFISIWALMFYYCISNNLPREKTVNVTYKLSFFKYVF